MQVAEYFAALRRDEKPLDPRRPSGQMGKVISALPLNVLVNDQLTPSRSQIEATAAFVPDYVRDDVNFATDSATVLSIHIATRYPHLEDRRVDWWVEAIMRLRRPTPEDRRRYPRLLGPLPNPLAKDRPDARFYADFFKERLAAEEETAAR